MVKTDIRHVSDGERQMADNDIKYRHCTIQYAM